MSEKKIINARYSGEIIEKKSRFIATLAPANTEEEAASFIDEIKKKYWDAKHNCSAFVIGDNNELVRSSDDGEPSGTAGRPMLEVLQGVGLHNTAVVVTRYFGGILLGTGGLVRAYQAAVKAAIDNADIISVRKGHRYNVITNYNDLTTLQKYFENENYIMENMQYSDKVMFDAIFPVENVEKALDKVKNITMGKAVFGDKGECEFYS